MLGAYPPLSPAFEIRLGAGSPEGGEVLEFGGRRGLLVATAGFEFDCRCRRFIEKNGEGRFVHIHRRGRFGYFSSLDLLPNAGEAVRICSAVIPWAVHVPGGQSRRGGPSDS